MAWLGGAKSIIQKAAGVIQGQGRTWVVDSVPGGESTKANSLTLLTLFLSPFPPLEKSISLGEDKNNSKKKRKYSVTR